MNSTSQPKHSINVEFQSDKEFPVSAFPMFTQQFFKKVVSLFYFMEHATDELLLAPRVFFDTDCHNGKSYSIEIRLKHGLFLDTLIVDCVPMIQLSSIKQRYFRNELVITFTHSSPILDSTNIAYIESKFLDEKFETKFDQEIRSIETVLMDLDNVPRFL